MGLDGFIIPKNDQFFGEYVSKNNDKLTEHLHLSIKYTNKEEMRGAVLKFLNEASNNITNPEIENPLNYLSYEIEPSNTLEIIDSLRPYKDKLEHKYKVLFDWVDLYRKIFGQTGTEIEREQIYFPRVSAVFFSLLAP